LLRALRRQPLVHRAVAAVRHAVCVRETVHFAVREVRRAPGAHAYRLRGSGREVTIRHDGHDAWVLHEVFGARSYDPPPEVVALLRRRPCPRVVDLGGHLGIFGLFVLERFPDADITAFEPDPANARLLRATIAGNGREAAWRVHEAAACAHDGWVRFASGLGERSHVPRDGEAGGIEVPAVDVFPHLGAADLLKLDIEGGEWALLGDPRFAGVAADAIALEYHAFACPEPDPKVAATRILERLGYAVRQLEDASLSREVGMLWAWRPAATPRAEPRPARTASG
jgi:FkbM family methyltransferase